MPEQQIQISYDSIDDVPESFRSLYDESEDGKAVLAGVEGMKTAQDVQNVQEALRKERNDKKALDDQVKSWKALGESPEEIQQRLDRMAELETAAEGKIDDDKINQLVEGRLKQKAGPLERQIETLSSEKSELEQKFNTLQREVERRDMRDAIRSVATEMKVLSTAIPDVEIIAERYLERDDNGNFITRADAPDVTPGVDVKQFMKEMQKKRPHWFPQSEGGGAFGPGGVGDGSNPWGKNSWNLSKQGEIVRQQGMAVAERMAKAAGSKVGATRPPE